MLERNPTKESDKLETENNKLLQEEDEVRRNREAEMKKIKEEWLKKERNFTQQDLEMKQKS